RTVRQPSGGQGEGAGAKDRFPIGFVSSGLTYCYLEHALQEMGLTDRFPILKLGLTYPVDPQAVLSLAQQVEAIYVVEEKRGFVEAQIVQILRAAAQRPPHHGLAPGLSPQGGEVVFVPVWGKTFPNGLAGIPETRGLNPSVIMERLIPLLLKVPTPLSE